MPTELRIAKKLGQTILANDGTALEKILAENPGLLNAPDAVDDGYERYGALQFTIFEHSFSQGPERRTDTEVFEQLIGLGADVNMVDARGIAPLMIAAYDADIKFLHLLLSHGAEVDKTNELGVSALHYACANPSQAVEPVECLLKAGADPNRKTKKGNTPMHFIHCDKESDTRIMVQIFQLLVEYGADPNAANLAGETPWNMKGLDTHEYDFRREFQAMLRDRKLI